MATTFVLQPDDYSNITFTCITPMGPESALSNYEIELSSILLNEGDRIAYEYAQYQHREGGEVRDTMYPLVPLAFRGRIVGLGATFALRLQDLLAKTGALMRAINNSSGYLQYKPDGLAGTVMDTYYKYLQAAPPRPLPGGKEFWGAARASVSGVSYLEGIPSRQFDISLMTMPIAMSDPTSPIQVLEATTLNNISDGTNDYVTIASATVRGDLPALTRIIAHPLTAAAEAAIGKLWIAKRTSGLASFVSTYLTATALDPVGAWSTETDASRCDGSYYRCTPVVNDLIYARRYTIANWSSHKGRAAILVVVRSNGTAVDDFVIYYRWAIANYPLVGEEKKVVATGRWEVLLLGEIDLPETEMSSQEDLDLYVDICIKRTAGSGTFDLDCMKLLYTDEAAIQADMPAGYGADTTHSFLLENFDEEIAHTIVQATDKLAYICNPYGDFITLEPDSDNRLDVAWERYIYTVFEDDFSGYATYWKKVADFETDESWTTGTQQISWVFEGERSLHNPSYPSISYLPSACDFSMFSEDDWVCVTVRTWTEVVATLELGTTLTDYYFLPCLLAGSTTNYVKMKIGDLTAVHSPSWDNITVLTIGNFGGWVDDWRISAVDQDDAAAYDETGGVWDIQTGEWHIYELDGAEKSFGQINNEAAVEKVVLIHTDYGESVKYYCKCKAKHQDGQVGLVFRCSDGTGGSEDCYALLLDTSADQLKLRSYIAGAPGDVAAAVAYTFNKDIDYYLGVKVSGTSIQCFVSTASSTLWNSANRQFNETDSDHTSGQCGLMTIGAIGRFTDVRLEATNDLHIPADQIQLSAYALFRTIYPFHEASA